MRLLFFLLCFTSLSVWATDRYANWKPPCFADFAMMYRRLTWLKQRFNPELAGQPLTAEETEAVGNYTGSWASYVNPHLRRLWWEPEFSEKWATEVPENYQKQVEQCILGLAKLPAWEGTAYRGARLRPEKLATYEVGKLVNETSFFSTSRELDQAFSSTDLGDGGVLYEVRSKRGRSIEHLSPGHASEKEVLFQPFTTFKVIERTTTTHKGFNVTKIVLEEVVPKGLQPEALPPSVAALSAP